MNHHPRNYNTSSHAIFSCLLISYVAVGFYVKNYIIYNHNSLVARRRIVILHTILASYLTSHGYVYQNGTCINIQTYACILPFEECQTRNSKNHEAVLGFVESAFGRVANKTVGTMFERSIRPNTYLIRIEVIKIFRFAIV
mgnify:CR=1 FL=1